MKLFSYVVHHDTGLAPNVFGGYCTLVCCKFSKKRNWKNIVEQAKLHDWIIGTGGNGEKSAGHGKMIYAMKVTQSLTLKEYCASRKFRGRDDADHQAIAKQPWRRALVSSHYCYFGRNAIPIPQSLAAIEKKGPGYKCKFEEQFGKDFVKRLLNWLERQKSGKQGQPCAGMGSACRASRKPHKC